MWADLNVTVEEGLDERDRLCATEISIAGHAAFQSIPEPSNLGQKLLDAACVQLPSALPKKGGDVVTRKKLPEHRKPLNINMLERNSALVSYGTSVADADLHHPRW